MGAGASTVEQNIAEAKEGNVKINKTELAKKIAEAEDNDHTEETAIAALHEHYGEEADEFDPEVAESKFADYKA
eukprot:CAMPEP_0171465420 /NCGR_PEP_ID=MMETSP0945-20130129/8485_1 /TAXON_ID=109269 /ORGANISM="Vaucheria litorea, Strain CCMP2940" /LENGTH=73 /DNA_ID=CAMNT_0011992983 /DNA_START=23 /DNA_END=241 /DNA_ORIENTATION=+